MAHDEQVPYRISPVRHIGKGKIAHSLEHLQIFFSDPFASLIPLIEFCQLDPQDGRLEFIKARIEALPFIVVFNLRTIVTQNANASS